MLPGTDPVLGSEYVVYTAHLDHIGELHGEGHDDAINNGALDNASGVSVMLETARIFKEAGGERRSILFVAVTAEEKRWPSGQSGEISCPLGGVAVCIHCVRRVWPN